MMVISKQYQIFFDFLRFCIGAVEEIPESAKDADWNELYRLAQKQALVGILFDGIQKLPPAEVGMSKDLFLQWMMLLLQTVLWIAWYYLNKTSLILI